MPAPSLESTSTPCDLSSSIGQVDRLTVAVLELAQKSVNSEVGT